MRATPLSSGRHGSTANVDGSGMAIMSDSSIALKPVIDEPSKPMPPSKASSSSCALIEKLFSWPRMSVNQRRTKRMSRSSTKALTSSAVCGWSAMQLLLKSAYGAGERYGLQPGARPGLERADGRLERLALPVSAYSTRTGMSSITRRSTIPSASSSFIRSDSSRSERSGTSCLTSEKRSGPVHQDEQDRAGPALADQLDGLVVGGAAGLAPLRRRSASAP